MDEKRIKEWSGSGMFGVFAVKLICVVLVVSGRGESICLGRPMTT